MKRMIYADHAATTPLSKKAQAAMTEYLAADFYNPSAKYMAAQKARKDLEQARGIIAECIGADPEEIYFTSGGTEADNWALKGTAFRYPIRSKKIITTAIEAETAECQEEFGQLENANIKFSTIVENPATQIETKPRGDVRRIVLQAALINLVPPH